MRKIITGSVVVLGALGFAAAPSLAACGHDAQSVQVEQSTTTVQSDQTVQPLTQTAQQPTSAK